MQVVSDALFHSSVTQLWVIVDCSPDLSGPISVRVAGVLPAQRERSAFWRTFNSEFAFATAALLAQNQACKLPVAAALIIG